MSRIRHRCVLSSPTPNSSKRVLAARSVPDARAHGPDNDSRPRAGPSQVRARLGLFRASRVLPPQALARQQSRRGAKCIRRAF
ncbi:hypothetical protein BGLA2_2770001 [Burkholderia gladioli]|nr:hypothetical protein BGLA2_2770001 [Burkholderia gladioli]